ncbi:DNA/RNA nuclease SfsA [Candidatus Dependentiae bacterium]|nr:MAG: DNA/RNA nuclease SfsA [Candidatus Dependentiae bacterium]
MKFEYPLLTGTLIKRYKRFLADIHTTAGDITIHCPNTGSMRGCAEPGSPVWFWDSGNPKRKYRHSWELVENSLGHMIGINTHRANHLVREAIENKILKNFEYDVLQTEVIYGEEKSRIDLLLTKGDKKNWIEVKNTSLLEIDEKGNAQGYFPDSVTSRGTKHLRELMLQLEQGDQATLIFCVQHSGIKSVKAAAHLDPLYAKTLSEAAKAGVRLVAAETKISDTEIKIIGELPVILE